MGRADDEKQIENKPLRTRRELATTPVWVLIKPGGIEMAKIENRKKTYCWLCVLCKEKWNFMYLSHTPMSANRKRKVKAQSGVPSERTKNQERATSPPSPVPARENLCLVWVLCLMKRGDIYFPFLSCLESKKRLASGQYLRTFPRRALLMERMRW